VLIPRAWERADSVTPSIGRWAWALFWKTQTPWGHHYRALEDSAFAPLRDLAEHVEFRSLLYSLMATLVISSLFLNLCLEISSSHFPNYIHGKIFSPRPNQRPVSCPNWQTLTSIQHKTPVTRRLGSVDSCTALHQVDRTADCDPDFFMEKYLDGCWIESNALLLEQETKDVIIS
jgi:hypothetical protein